MHGLNGYHTNIFDCSLQGLGHSDYFDSPMANSKCFDIMTDD